MTLAAFSLVLAALYGDPPDLTHAWCVHDWHRPQPVKVEPAAKSFAPPSDAVVLFDGTAASFAANWCDKEGQPSQWKLGTEGDFYCVAEWKNGGDIFTRAKFGDCQLHLEFRHEADIQNHPWGSQMRGNSGVFLMDNYEIQILESYYTSSNNVGSPTYIANYADGTAGAVYAENPPLVNALRKPGEWQTYDIVFHQPVWADGKLLHNGSVTLFVNGILVQDHWEMEGLTTHLHRRPLAPHATVGPLKLQDHGCVVHFRNIWLRPIASRWDNKTHSSLSADPAEVMRLRRATAAGLYAAIPQPPALAKGTVADLGEVIAYAPDAVYTDALRALLVRFAETKDPAKIREANDAVRDLIRRGVLNDSYYIAEP